MAKNIGFDSNNGNNQTVKKSLPYKKSMTKTKGQFNFNAKIAFI